MGTAGETIATREVFFDLVHDSVIVRTMEGTINFWNRSAEILYGWRKEEAIGRVSHNLLQTKFPQPLEEIESELVRNGVWKGRLVHKTRDGEQVVVESRWALPMDGESEALVEINTPSANEDPSANESPDVIKAAARLTEQTTTPLQQQEHLIDLLKDSVITRALDGTIRFWNHSAEILYGWRKEEAIGRISHELLRTQFPEPLEAIESQLTSRGRWQGELVHTTRNGERVVVDSLWTVDSGALLEINARYGGRADGSLIRTNTNRRHDERQRMTSALSNAPFRGLIADVNKSLLSSAAFLFLCAAIVTILYRLFGTEVIRVLYDDKSAWLVDKIMAGKAVLPISAYYQVADQWISAFALWTLAVVVVLLGIVMLLREPMGVLLACSSLFMFSFVLFSAIEVYPSLINRFGLDRINYYYAWQRCCLPDKTFVFRYRPFAKATSLFKGYLYSPVYGVDVTPLTVELTTDKNGFIYNNATPEFPDLLLIGDSFVADGLNERDTFGRRLERISGFTVANLGVPGYGPFQYLRVLEKYGIPFKPQYAFFVFYSGNDIEDMREYQRWKNGGDYYKAEILQLPFLARYIEALKGGARFVADLSGTLWQATLLREKQYYHMTMDIHPDIAVVNAGGSERKMLVPAENKIRSTAELLASREGQALKQILGEFKELCRANGIVPMVIYIPTVTTIYAEHSTQQSGANWLKIRDEQISRKRETENALLQLASSVNMEIIDLTPIFESAADQGRFLYHPFDTHWNSEGREVAAAYVASVLKRKAFVQN